MAERRLSRRVPPRLFSVILGALLAFSSVLGGLLHVAGAATDSVFLHLGLATACVVLASLAWEVVVRRALRPSPERAGEPPGVCAWLAFPLAVILGMAALPFLTLVVYPPAGEFFTRSGRVTASIARDPEGLLLYIDFPEPTAEQGENLRINGEPLPEGYVRGHPEGFVWRGPRTLSVAIEPLLGDLGIERIERVGINQLFGVPRFTYLSGKTVPQQRVIVAPATR